MRCAVWGRLGDRGAYLVAFGVCVCERESKKKEIWRDLGVQTPGGEEKYFHRARVKFAVAQIATTA